jgi:serine/threonine protein kinase
VRLLPVRPAASRPPFRPLVADPQRDRLRDQLQTSLGTAYTLERELGGGGMSRVFVAREEALGRAVVVKVLAPELAEGLSAERFAREVRLAASPSAIASSSAYRSSPRATAGRDCRSWPSGAWRRASPPSPSRCR